MFKLPFVVQDTYTLTTVVSIESKKFIPTFSTLVLVPDKFTFYIYCNGLKVFPCEF